MNPLIRDTQLFDHSAIVRLQCSETYREASLPAMFRDAIVDGIAAGIVPRSNALCAQLAWAHVQSILNADGLLLGVSVATPPGDMRYHNGLETGAGFP